MNKQFKIVLSFVKTYQEVNPIHENLNFDISTMEEIYEKRGGIPDEPHRHDYYTVLIVQQADGVHKIDFNDYKLSKNQMFFVAPGQVHQIVENKQSVGFVMTFTTDFVVENAIHLSFIESLHLFNNYGENPPLLFSDEEFQSIVEYANRIYELFCSDRYMKFLSIGAFLKIMLIECNNLCTINPIESSIDRSGDQLIRDFKQEVETHYKTNHSTSYYANLLHISPDHLNKIVKARIGKTAKDFIQTRIITEAKRLLYFTDETNKEIAYELGFNAPANFSAFFKKHTQFSPTEFKINSKTL